MSVAKGLLTVLCRSSYYVSLLGLKIPLGLLVNASRAPHVLVLMLCVWTPLLAYCHVALVPGLAGLPEATSTWVWHSLWALWFTIPLLVVGNVILQKARGAGPLGTFMVTLVLVAAFHVFGIPALVADPGLGIVTMHCLMAFFEDMPILGWVWCLVYVVRVQKYALASQAGRQSPFEAANSDVEDRVLVVGNAPTLVEGEALGPLVDSFQQVVRFNTYTLSKPAWTGSRVTHHFCNGRNHPQQKTVKAVMPLFNASLTHAVYLFMPHMEEASDIYASLTSDKVDTWFVEEDRILSLRRKLGCLPWQIPTSGAVAIDAFLSARQCISLHGFNFFQSKKIHYFEESPVQLITSWLERFVTHDPSLEKVWVEGLVNKGRASFLGRPCGVESSDGFEQKLKEKEDGLKEDSELRRRAPGLVQTLLRDGFPSQFSL